MFLIFASMTLFLFWVESSPVHDPLEYDKLDTDISKLSYQIEDGDLDDFNKFADEETTNTQAGDENSKLKINTTGYKEKNTVDKGLEKNYNIEDLKKFFKSFGSHEAGTHDDGDIYAFIKGLVGKGVGITGNEERKYKKGTKTRGYHRVLHKDEYKKDKEIYEDDETSGVIKKIGAKGVGFQIGGGAGFDKGYFHHDNDKGLFGKQGLSDKGSEDKSYKGYSDSQGFDAYFQSEKK